MMNWVWSGMILVSIGYAFVSGNTAALTQGIFAGARQAVELTLTMLGVICFWNGIMTVANRSGAVEWLSRLLRPVIRFLFPGVPDRSAAQEAICMNMTANLIGLGNAATPFGLKAMRELSDLSGTPRYATDEMITFVVINTASLQLIPTGLAMLRSQYGSAAPMEILPCVWLSSAAAMIVAVSLAKLGSLRRRPLLPRVAA